MSKTVIKVENISKMYDLGLVGTGTLSKDLNRTWAKFRGRPDPYASLAELNDRTQASKSGTVWALKDINFEVGQGEVLGVIGKNGAGKSTLLKILSRITSPTRGEIKIKGRVASLLEVGTGMHPEMTARQNIYLNGAIMGMTRKEVATKLDEIVDFAGIGKYVDTPIKRFSSGMQVRLGFAVAAFLEPEILIVDEVLAVGDVEFQRKAIGKMKEVSQGEGRTVLFVSHNMASVKSLCEYAILLNGGLVSYRGKADDVVNYYLLEEQRQVNNLCFQQDSKSACLNKISLNEGVASSIVSGKELVFSFVFKQHFSKNMNIHVGIYDSNNEKLIHMTTEYFFSKGVGKDEVRGIIDKNPLKEGFYSVNVAIISGGEIIEVYEKCIVFSVLNGDFFDKGILLKSISQSGKFLADYYWD